MTNLDREINRIKEIMLIHEGKSLISEGAETRNMKAAKHYLYNKLGYDEQQAMKFIGKVKTVIPNSRLAKCKFMLGVVRMTCEGQLQGGRTIMSLNKCLKYVASEAYVNDYDNDLNGMSVEEIVNRFSVLAQSDLEKDKAEVGNEAYDTSRSQYKIVKINSFEEAKQYGKYTSWCVTHFEVDYNIYTHKGEGIFYFCLRNGFENEPKEIGKGCPWDSYGLSMIAVSINPDGSVNTITCRWNHENDGNDNIMTPKQLSNVINMNFYEVFKPRTKEKIEQMWQRKIDKAIQYLSAISENDIKKLCEKLPFDSEHEDVDKRDFYVYNGHFDGLFIFNLKDIKMYHKLLIDMPFDEVYYRSCDMILVKKNKKYNFVSTKGEILSPNLWFDEADIFCDGFANIKLKNKCYIIDKKGRIIRKEFDEISLFRNGFARVKRNNKWNFIDANKNILSPNLWFDGAGPFNNNGYAYVNKEGKYNVIDTNGQLVYPNQWFSILDEPIEGFSIIEKDGKYNFISNNGQILSPNLWFDSVRNFSDGWAQVKKDGKYNYINTKGQLDDPNWES